MLGLDIVSFPHSMSLLFFCLLKKIGVKDAEFLFLFSFDSFSDIACLFA
jgi:hypothetical protein